MLERFDEFNTQSANMSQAITSMEKWTIKEIKEIYKKIAQTFESNLNSWKK